MKLPSLIVLSIFASALAWPAMGEDAKTATPGPKRKKHETATTTLDQPGWIKLFDGTTLKGWKVTDFIGRKDVKIKDEQLILEMGNDMTGVTWTNDCLRMNYEIVLEAQRVAGGDFFCGLTFPVETNSCTLVCGGWGGGVVGISSLNGGDAANNETTHFKEFENGKWYRIRIRVTPNEIEAWIDEDKMIDVDLADKSVGVRREVELSKPLGIATWRTTGAVRDLRWRSLK